MCFNEHMTTPQIAHTYRTCEGRFCASGQGTGSCEICDGGLLDCLVCGQAEGALEDSCPGHGPTREEINNGCTG